jgi:hypothetical protein
MTTAILKGNSKADIQLLIDIARKIGIDAKILTQEEIEDVGLAFAIKEGETGQYVDPDSFLDDLRK